MPLATAFALQCRFFTFQSGSIQIYGLVSSESASNSFTFQSGSIQMSHLHHREHLEHPLHSNLVLFKWQAQRTWQRYYFLYIPIWFYSNENGISYERLYKFFTFQSGSIQMSLINRKCWAVVSLHSNLVLFKSPFLIKW